jgi:hypothetical protein
MECSTRVVVINAENFFVLLFARRDKERAGIQEGRMRN